VRIKRTLGTLALASTLVLAGCSDDDGGDDASNGDAASGSPTATEDETDEPDGDDDIAEFLEKFEEGVEATTTARMTMTVTAQGDQIDIEGDVDYTTDPASIAMRLSGGSFGGQEIELRIVDGIVYMNLGATSQNKFLELSLDQLGAQAGIGDITEQLDPNAQLDTYREGLTEVEFVGDEEVGGVDTEHYFLVVDTTEVEDTPAGTPETLELDIWLDDEGRAVQTESDLGALGTVTAKVFDFGADIEVEKPAPSEIQQLPSS